MAESNSPSGRETCANCVDPGARACQIAALALGESVVPCNGPVVVHRGEIVIQRRGPGESAPEKGTWYGMAGHQDGSATYTGVAWDADGTSEVCGGQPVNPADGEVPYSYDDPQQGTDGKTHVTFVRGNPEDRADFIPSGHPW